MLLMVRSNRSISASIDLPFYNGKPTPLRGAAWTFLLLSVALAFVTLVTVPVRSFPAMLLHALLFAAIPLLALRQVAARHWTALFGSIGLKEARLMILYAVCTIAASSIAALAVQAVGTTAPNPAVAAMARMTTPDFILRLISTLPQLVGEELMTIVPFLAILWLMTERLHTSRMVGIAVATAGSSLLFAAAHLPTYDWHWAQCFGVIGTARIVLTLAYIRTRNLWVSTGAHVLNDWFEFTLTFALSHVPIGTD
jgi:uncharacterized protein